jgi:hypothetical protein
MDPACTGHPGRFCYCIAEDEDEIWEPLHVQRGFERGQSAVTVVNLEAPQHVRDDSASTPERLLSNYADHARSWNQPGAAVAVFNPEHRAVVQQAGWSKEDVARFLHEASVRTVAGLKQANKLRGPIEPGDEEREFRWSRGPADFLVVGGGGYGAFSVIIPPWAGAVHSEPVTREVVLA